MAKFEARFNGDVQDFINYIERSVLKGSSSAELEDSSNFEMDNVRVAVRVFESYSAFGGNRLSLNVTIVSQDDNIVVSAITSGGSQAVFFKVNTVGEENFLAKLEKYVNEYLQKSINAL